MKLNKTNLFALIWILHLFIYYTSYVVIIRIVENNYDEFYTVLGGFIGGIMGWFEQIPFFILIPIIIMLILINTFLKKLWFRAYLIATGVSYLLNYLWMFLEDKYMSVLYSTMTVNLIYIIIPSLLVTFLINWMIFRKTYIKIETL